MKQSDSSQTRPDLSALSQAGVTLSVSPPAAAPTRAARVVRPRWLLLGLAVAIIFTDAVGYTVIIPALPSFAAELGLGETRTGTLYASYGLISLLLYLPFGLLVDRWGERRWLTVGMLALGLASLGFWQADGFWSLLGCRVTQGVAASATWGCGPPPRGPAGDHGATWRGNERPDDGLQHWCGCRAGPRQSGSGA